MFKPFYPPSHYQPSHSNPPTVFQLPTHLTSFSYSPSRQLLLAHNKDAAISVYSPPQLGSDLNTGFNDCIWSTPTDEGLDALLDTLLDWEDRDHSGQARDLLKRVNVVTWRGIMSKLLVAVYEVDNAATATGGGGRADGWELNAMVIDVRALSLPRLPTEKLKSLLCFPPTKRELCTWKNQTLHRN